MKIFGFTIGKASEPKSTEEETNKLYNDYLKLVRYAEKDADNYKHLPLAKAINEYCLTNPDIVANLIFNQISDRVDLISYRELSWKKNMRNELIFALSKDDNRSTTIRDNQKWASFMRQFIIPRINELDKDTVRQIEWYQSVHGL